jgi:hypothetical protein
LALFSRTAVISLRFWVIMLSRVMISQPRAATCGIQSVSSTSGLVIGHGTRSPLVDHGSGIAWVGHVAAEAGQDLAQAQDVSVDVDADLGRTRAHAAALVAGHGMIVAEFFDAGESRTLPWTRRL